MGWTLSGNEFFFGNQRQLNVHEDGNNVAWQCPDCEHPMLFIFLSGRRGSAERVPATCRRDGCAAAFYLFPEWSRPLARPTQQAGNGKMEFKRGRTVKFTRGTEYDRSQIAGEFGRKRDPHAVVVVAGRAVAIVVTQSGRSSFTGRQYLNSLTSDTFKMQGEYDDRGSLLESGEPLHLFLLHDGAGGYTYEGRVRFRPPTIDYAGQPSRTFDRLPE